MASLPARERTHRGGRLTRPTISRTTAPVGDLSRGTVTRAPARVGADQGLTGYSFARNPDARPDMDGCRDMMERIDERAAVGARDTTNVFGHPYALQIQSHTLRASTNLREVH